MALLLDTHAFLWFVGADPRLSAVAAKRIASSDETVFVSVVTPWEIAIKTRIGKLAIGMPLADLWEGAMRANSFAALAVTPEHALRVDELPLHHRDPFDRMLAAQCLTESATLVGRDPVFDAYGVTRVW